MSEKSNEIKVKIIGWSMLLVAVITVFGLMIFDLGRLADTDVLRYSIWFGVPIFLAWCIAGACLVSIDNSNIED